MNQRKDQMHPEDLRNMIIFFGIAIVLYFSYDFFIARPHQQATERAQVAQEKAIAAQKVGKVDAALEMLPRETVLRADGRIKFDNGEIFGSISLKGGRIDDVSFHEFYETLDKKENVSLLSPANTEFPRYIDYGWVALDKGTKLPDDETVWRVSGKAELSKDTPVKLFWNNGRGLRFEREIALDEHYVFTVKQRVVNNSSRQVTLYPYALIAQTGLPENLENMWIMHEGPMGFIGEELVEVDYSTLKDDKQISYQATNGWTGIGDKYWLTALVPAQGENTKYRYNYIQGPVVPKGKPDRSRYQVDMMGEGIQIASGNKAEVTTHTYTGAKKVILLNDYAEKLDVKNFELAVDFGWFWFMTKPFFYALHFLFGMVGNFGIAILLLTLVIRSAVFPLTNLSYVSFAKMKKVAPQMTDLREKHGDDRAALQKAMMELYQREGVNPMSGCLPILLQIPIFFALYKVLFITIEMRHAPFYGWIKDLSAQDPTTLFNLFGLLPYDVPSFLQIGIWPCLMLLVMIVQRQLNPPPQDPIQRDMMKFFPFVITFIMAKFAAGLVMYWTFSAFLSVLQQMFIMRRLGVPIHLFGETEEEKKLDEAIDKGPAVHPLAEMAEDEVEDALFGTDNPVEPEKKISKPKPKKSKPKSGSKSGSKSGKKKK